jgi:hypothetical protein
MRRWLRLGVAAIAVAALLGACGGEEEAPATVTATPTSRATVTSEATVTPKATAMSTPTPRATATPRATLAPKATATPTPTPTPAAPTPQVRQPSWSVSQIPGEGQVQIVVEDGVNTYTVASLDPEWTQFDKWDIEFVADVNADGIVEAIAGHYTGGAHCCFEYLIFSETPSGIQLDDWFSLGNGGIRAVEDLDGDGIPELDGSDDRLAYFPDLPFAASPFLPLVLCRSADATYSDCTPQFPRKLQGSADEFEGQLRDAVQGQAEEIEKRYAALGLLASYMRLGMGDEGWSRVRGLCPECEGWLRQNLGELEQRLRLVQPAPPIQPPTQ